MRNSIFPKPPAFLEEQLAVAQLNANVTRESVRFMVNKQEVEVKPTSPAPKK